MILNLLVIALVLIDGSFRSSVYLVEDCPEPETFISNMEELLKSREIVGWSAKCSEFEFVPVDLEKLGSGT